MAALQRELAEQEAHWKEAYDTLVAENTALKSSGAEALLAAQWRKRYEDCQREKEDLETNFKMVQSQVDILQDRNKAKDAGKYEVKYRDLKESFRLYRKKAKEIFEAQQSGNTQVSQKKNSWLTVYNLCPLYTKGCILLYSQYLCSRLIF